MDIEKIAEKLREWEYRVNAYQEGHYAKAESQIRWHYGLGLPTIIITTITASTIFANLQDSVSETTKIVLAGICLLSSILSAIQTFYSHAKRAERNRAVAATLSAVRREMDIFDMFPPKSEEEALQRVKELNDRLNEIAADAPVINLSNTSRILFSKKS